jgi:hypothetical protein
MGLDTIARVFKAITDVGDGLPIHIIVCGLEARRNVGRRYAYDFQQPLQSKPSRSITSERSLRDPVQYLLNRVNRRQNVREAIC